MDLGGALSNLVMNAGDVQIAGTAYDQARAEADMKQMSALTMKQELKDRREASAEAGKATAAFQASAQTDADLEKYLIAKESIDLKHNLFDSAKQMSEMASQVEVRKKNAEEAAAKEVTGKQNALSTAAWDFDANPTPESAKAVVDRAIAAGVPGNTIPMFSKDPEGFKRWATNQQSAGPEGEKKMDMALKHQDIEARNKATAAQQAATLAQRTEAERDRVTQRETALDTEKYRAQTARMLEEERVRHDLAMEVRADARAAKGGTKVGLNEQKVSDTVIRNAAQGVRVLDNMLSVPHSAAASLFAQIKGGNITDSLAKAGGNWMTAEADQEVTAIGAEMGVILGQVVTAGSGGRAALPIVQSFQQMATPQQGDSDNMKLLRIVNAAEIFNLELKNITPGATDELEASRQSMKDWLGKLPSTKDVLKMLPERERKDANAKYLEMVRKASDLRTKAEALPKTGGGAGGGLPTGFKED